MLHQQPEEAQGCHDDNIVVALFAGGTRQKQLRVIFGDMNLKQRAGGEDEEAPPMNSGCYSLQSYLSSIELEEGEVRVAGHTVQAKDAIYHPSPNLD